MRAWIDEALDYHRRDQQDTDNSYWQCPNCTAYTYGVLRPDDMVAICDVCGHPAPDNDVVVPSCDVCGQPAPDEDMHHENCTP